MNNKKQKKIVIFGLNNTGLKILKELKKKNKFKIKLITKNNYSKKSILNFSPDFIFSLGYRKKIDPAVLKYAKLGSFNLHKSLLPLHSGANPIFWTILNNTPAGHTIHKMNDKIDAGEIILQKKVRYYLSFDARGLYEKVEKEQIKDFFKFITRPNFYLKRPKKNKFNKKNYHFIENFKKFKKVNFFSQKKYWNTISLLRALTFQPFSNIIFKINRKLFSVSIKIKVIKELKKKNYDRINEY